MTDSGVRIAPAAVAVADGELVGIDWLNFTVSEDVVRHYCSVPGTELVSRERESIRLARLLPVSDVEVLRFGCELLRHLVRVDLGDFELLGRRHLGWAVSARVGDAAILAAGGNGNTIFWSLSGHGCLLAGTAGLARIADFVERSSTGKITRIDLAFEDLDGRLFPLREVLPMWEAGWFDSPGGVSRPKLEQRGDWRRDDPNRLGLTAYIGSRQTGQLLRIYEKGKQLGDKDSPWVRVEAELHSSCFLLLPEMLRHPTKFFVAAKPAFERIRLGEAEGELQRMVRLGLADADKAIAVLRKQYGAVIHALRTQWFADDEALLAAISRPGRISPALRRALEVREVALKRATN